MAVDRLGFRALVQPAVCGSLRPPQLADRSTANLERFVAGTRRAETVHWCNLGAGPFFLIWCPVPLGLVMVAFGVVVHLPFIAIQRYNRARLLALLARRRARSLYGCNALASSRGTSIVGSSWPELKST